MVVSSGKLYAPKCAGDGDWNANQGNRGIVLRVKGPAAHGDPGHRIAAQDLDRVAGLEIVLAKPNPKKGSTDFLPRRLVVDERVVERLRHFMAERGHVLESEGEESVRQPTGVVQHIAVFLDAVLAIAGLEVIGVESEDAALD